MSNFLAAAAVTASLKLLIQEAVGVGNVTVGRPSGGADAAESVNLFLYQAVPNAALRNAHQPSTRQDGSRSGPSIVALNLHYLISFTGPTETYAAEQLMGKVARKLQYPGFIPVSTIRSVALDVPALGDTDLQFAHERVHINPLSLSLDELSKLWSVLFQIPYLLSVAYTCSPILIETEESGSAGLPVSKVGITALVLGGPSLFGVVAEAGAWMPILWGSSIVLSGKSLGRGDIRLLFNGQKASLGASSITNERIVLPLTAASFPAGPLRSGTVLVETVLPPLPGATASISRVSDQASFVLRPVLTLGANAIAGGVLTVGISPPLQEGQQAFLLLDAQTATEPRSYRIMPNAIAAYPAANLVFPIAGITAATYYVQVVVDGTTSAPHLDTDPVSPSFRQIIGPKVQLP